MFDEIARSRLPVYAAQHIDDEFAFQKEKPKIKPVWKMIRWFDAERFKKRYGIVLIGAALFTLYTIILSSCVHAAAVREVRADLQAEYAVMMEDYKREQAEAAQAEHWLSGDASREAAINQAVDAVAQVIARLSTDAQKATEACCMLARVMSPLYPNSFQEVAEQPQQWMFYDGTNKTFTEHDREIADSVIRPYMESGIIPYGLTDRMVYGEWSANDFVLRDSYKTTSTMHTFRWAG